MTQCYSHTKNTVLMLRVIDKLIFKSRQKLEPVQRIALLTYFLKMKHWTAQFGNLPSHFNDSVLMLDQEIQVSQPPLDRMRLLPQVADVSISPAILITSPVIPIKSKQRYAPQHPSCCACCLQLTGRCCQLICYKRGEKIQ